MYRPWNTYEPSPAECKKIIKEIEEFGKTLNTKKKVLKFLIQAGILAKDGKGLAKKYR